ncbi:hypothetical protein [Actinoplanes sp. NPDC049316]|uniref:hypothetical protein n=1 Tax=Actinoplanes sp. NPDC049316 TaxID=3154727 RepID=UPI003417F380
MSQFEGPVGGIKGALTLKPRDPAAPGTTPYIIQVDNPFEVEVDWYVAGDSAAYLGGKWHLRLYIAPADGTATKSGLLGKTDVDVSTVSSLPVPRKYSHTFKIAAGVMTEGVYHMTAVLTYDNGGPPLEMAAFGEIPFIEFYVA